MTTVQAKPFREMTRDGLMVHFHPGQGQAYDSMARIVAVICSTRWGKTVMGPHWLQREMALGGPGDYLAVTVTSTLFRQTMWSELNEVFCNIYKTFEWRAADRMFVSHEKVNGSPAYRIIVGFAISPSSLESATAKAAWLDEAGQHEFSLEAWEAVQRRVSTSFVDTNGKFHERGRIFITSTPYEHGWFKREIYDRWRDGDLEIDVIQGHALDNPTFSRQEYEEQRQKMPGWKFRMFYHGEFERPAGMIYDAFDDACIIPRKPLHPDWPRYVGHDFGLNNTAAVWFAHDPATGHLYLYRTYHQGGMHSYDHAAKFKELSEGENIIKRVGGSHQEQEIRDGYRLAGWPILESRVRDVWPGIDIVYGFHKRNALFVFSDQKEYLDELHSYSRKLDENYQPIDEEIANKSKYHLMDATRYILSDFGPERIAQRRSAHMSILYGRRGRQLQAQEQKRRVPYMAV